MKPTILVVDDDEDIVDVFCEALEKDYNVLTSGDGFRGMSELVLGDLDVDLIITDLKMPNCDGVDFMGDLPDSIPFIVVSAYLHVPLFLEELHALNPLAVLEKPVCLVELLRVVEEGLASAQFLGASIEFVAMGELKFGDILATTSPLSPVR